MEMPKLVKMKTICVFCGSSPGSRPEYAQSARLLGETLAHRKLTLVFGGGKVGMMGQVAKAALDAGGEVIGVIPRSLAKMDVAFHGLNQLIVVESMHERKARMAELSDAFIALPGGYGTIEEFFEIITWGQLGFHQKPCGILNICHYYDRLLSFLDTLLDQEFIDGEHRALVLEDTTIDGLLAKFEAFSPALTDKAAWALQKSRHIPWEN